MSLPSLGTLRPLPVLDHPELLGETVLAALRGWPGADRVAVGARPAP